MAFNLRNRHFLTLLDFSAKEIEYLLDLSRDLKRAKYTGTEQQRLKGKNIALIFEKDSTRTRCAFEVAAYDQGARVTYLGPSGSQIGKKESIKDTARVLGRMYDGIEYRGFGQEIVETLAEYAGVPVWNGLTNEDHPTQILADFLTMEEHFGALSGLKLVFCGDGRNNMANALMIGCAKMGVHYTVVAPEHLWPEETLVAKCREVAKESGAKIEFSADVASGVAGADVVYTDVWVSMGEPQAVWKERIDLLKPYQVNKKLMSYAKADAIFLHCLPAFHDEETQVGREIAQQFGMSELEVTNEVFESAQSKVFDEAENRLHTIKAVMVATLGS
ncbi:ornithine carbamoyltransferase [Entomospira culicis]|uniref:Ornithine carbamoyltransferase n=1 Tax=Entomospira culicis TaxID=2719989 RepID=A0A968GH23_9SPIO|nr:ornithine carbamoyltransferase [Entomospira culicis]NIZ19404.1 ornithine carbamoyltransferase [Entomospira culicis]NIZ69691.1 ornithine carbamoyltransferase [Entomospira culicis]WDI36801.1 ornithine carbamoyltransferase [Entomospira culicis]WDI38430.1 ornithine carbamoyltransferase [Entomospira culicis]